MIFKKVLGGIFGKRISLKIKSFPRIPECSILFLNIRSLVTLARVTKEKVKYGISKSLRGLGLDENSKPHLV